MNEIYFNQLSKRVNICENCTCKTTQLLSIEKKCEYEYGCEGQRYFALGDMLGNIF
jgi:hypothetical protein